MLYPHSSNIERWVYVLRDTDANSVVDAYPVMGDIIAAVNALVCNVLYVKTFV